MTEPLKKEKRETRDRECHWGKKRTANGIFTKKKKKNNTQKNKQQKKRDWTSSKLKLLCFKEHY